MRQLHKHLHNFFVPHEENDHLPYSVRHQSLIAYGGILIATKIFLLIILLIGFPNIAQFSTITQNRITELVNNSRNNEHQKQLSISPVLERAAQLKLKHMFDNSYFAHNAPDGTTPWEWFKRAGYVYTYAGENLAMNFVEAEDVHRAWMVSPTHRANIINSNYKEIGVAVGVGELNGEKVTLVVQFFGTSFVPPKVLVEEPSPSVMGEKVAALQEPKSELQIKSPEIPLSKINQEVQDKKEDLEQIPPKLDQPIIPEKAETQEVTLEKSESHGLIITTTKFIKRFFWIIIGFVALVLFIKVLIKPRIQHKKAILLTLFVILIGIILITVKLHFLESITGPVFIN